MLYASGGSSGKRPFGGGSGGGGRPPPKKPFNDKPPPADHIGAADFGEGGRLYPVVLELSKALGDPPSKKLLTVGKAEKPKHERLAVVRGWLDNHRTAPPKLTAAVYSELSLAFVHVVRAAHTAGMFDVLVEALTHELTARARASATADSDDDDE